MVDSKNVVNTGIVVGVIAIAIIAAVFLLQSNANAQQGAPVQQGNAQLVNFADSPYAATAHLVYSSTSNIAIQYAVNGFYIATNGPDNGSISINFEPLGNFGSDATYSFSVNDKLYYIGSANDSSQGNIAIVDPQGYIINNVINSSP